MKRLAAAGAVSLALYLVALAQPSWGREFTRFASLHGAVFVAYTAALAVVARRREEPGSDGFRVLLLVWAGAVLFRICALAAEPTLSDDVYRYIWDGRVFASGVNPYRFAPEAVELAHLRDARWPLINNPGLPTIYPPLLQLVFAGIAAVSPTAVAFKGAMAGFDLGTGWVLLRALRERGLPGVWVLAYLWNPLVVMEFAGQGHADAVGLFFLAAALYSWTRDRPFAAGLALTLSALVKFLPLVALPLVFRRLTWRWLAFPLVLAAFYLPFAGGGVDPLGSLGVYAAVWRANDFVFAWIHGGGAATEATLAEAKRVALWFPAAAWGLAAGLRRPWPSVYSWTVGIALLVSPIVHPWYVTWLLPALVFLPHPAWWLWSGTVILAYQPLPGFLETGTWTESAVVKGLEYWPVVLAVALQLVLERRVGIARRNTGRLLGVF